MTTRQEMNKELIDRLNEPDIHYPGNFDTPKRANAILMCLCQEAADALEQLQADNKKLRKLLFGSHGSGDHLLYGDDGVRSCNTCGIDFNTDSADTIEQKIRNYNMRKIAQLQAEGKWPPEFMKPTNEEANK